MKIEGLEYIWWESQDSFFKKLDAIGGWPNGFTLFTADQRNGLNHDFINSFNEIEHDYISLYTADEYYWWKISEQAKRQIKLKIMEDLRVHVDNWEIPND